MQEIVQAAMGKELPYSEYMKMFKPDLLEFSTELNNCIVKNYEMNKIMEYLEKSLDGDMNLSIAQEKKRRSSLQKVPIGFMI